MREGSARQISTRSIPRVLSLAATVIFLLPVVLLACGGSGISGANEERAERAERAEREESAKPTVSDQSSAPGAAEVSEATETGAATEAVTRTRLHGVDVSKFQGEIDWQAVKASGIVFAFARALEGETIHDSSFTTNWQGMKEAGVVRGAYDFYVAGDAPTKQVEVFAGLVTLEPGDLVPMVDIEGGSLGASAPPDLIADFHQYLELMESHYGVKPIIYTDPSFWNEQMDDSFGDYPLWVAEYGVDSPTPPKGWDAWALWQHSDSGSVPGIEGAVDLDLFDGGLEELARYRIPPPASED